MTEKLLRTFLSVPVPREVSSKKNMLYSTLETVDGDINWVKNAQLHLTLKFLGHTPESSIDNVIDHVQKITPNMKPFDLQIFETGCFPVPTRPRTLWLGVKGTLDPLLTMVEAIETVLESLGFSRSDRDFSPHITLARIKYPQKHTPNVDPFLKSSYDPIDFPVDRVQYFSSELLPTGAVYTILKTFPLGESL